MYETQRGMHVATTGCNDGLGDRKHKNSTYTFTDFPIIHTLK
jgi:hypothetical protein